MLFHTTAAYFEEVLEQSKNKTVLLDFYAPWCAPCRTLEPMLDSLSDRYENMVCAYSVNIDTDGDLAEQLDVKKLPTVLLLRDGKVSERFEKDITEETLEAAFDRV